MVAYESKTNQPWHEETDFDLLARLPVGDTADDDLTVAEWEGCRGSAESEILASLPNARRPLRTMLHRVSGELAPQHGNVAEDGDYSYTVQLENLVDTPTGFEPHVWKNYSGPWRDRWGVEREKLGDDYTITDNEFTFLDASEGDVFCIEYEHTLSTPPALLKSLSTWLTVERALISKYGVEHARLDSWARTYGYNCRRQLKLLDTGKLELPEFAEIMLYDDWVEERRSVFGFPFQRA